MIAPADVLSTGELQPRLPDEAGAVRDQELAHPPIADLADSFTLTPPEATEPTQTGLFRRLP